ncbi:aldehyde dehydrogenase family protein [Escherichia coli]|uniref:aldehyde dehydrogenase family protein n=1 Tax=Escherichia coli TaxID=562 RepID=UPI0034D3B2FA
MRPALFADAPADSTLWYEEIFGPVLCVRAFDTEDDARNAGLEWARAWIDNHS